MTRPNDLLVDDQQLRRVRDHARKALDAARAIGRFPTPVDEVIAAAGHVAIAHQEIDEGFLSKMRKAGGALKRALSKVLGVLDVTAKIMHLDKLVHASKLPFLKLHELGHGLLPWQREIYAIAEECDKTIDPEIADLFERESNAFASEVLFQLDGFTDEASALRLGLKAPLSLSKKYGASVYATVRRYVTTNARACAVVVLDPPELVEGDGFRARLRRVLHSPSFQMQFGDLALPEHFTPDDAIGRMVPTGSRRMSRPQSFAFTDINGNRHECVAEAFAHKYCVFILIYPIAAITRKNVVV